MSDFDEEDLVAVFGGEFGKDSHVADTVELCKVLVVGQNDLIVESSQSYSSTYHTVPKSICFKLHLEPTTLSSAKTLVPAIGDLVVSFSRRYTSEAPDKTSGILYKIIYKLGKADTCMILCGTEMISVNWDSLIVLDRPGGL